MTRRATLKPFRRTRRVRGRGVSAPPPPGGGGGGGARPPPPEDMRVPVLVKVAVFALLVMGAYTYYANSIPQVQSKPPEELSLEGGNVTPEQLVQAGEGVFKENG